MNYDRYKKLRLLGRLSEIAPQPDTGAARIAVQLPDMAQDASGGPVRGAKPAEDCPADIGSPHPDLAAASQRYAQRFTGPAGTWLLARQTDALIKLLGQDAGASVLDVGGGHGQVARPLLAAGCPVTVIGTSMAALQNLGPRDQPGLAINIAPLLPLPYPDQSFDIVTSFRILAHVGNWQGLIAEMTRVARRAVIFDFPTPGSFNKLQPVLFGLKQQLEGDTRRFDTMSRIDVSSQLGAHHFDMSNYIGQFVLPMVLHRKLQSPKVSALLEGGLGRLGLDRSLGTPIVARADRRTP